MVRPKGRRYVRESYIMVTCITTEGKLQAASGGEGAAALRLRAGARGAGERCARAQQLRGLPPVAGGSFHWLLVRKTVGLRVRRAARTDILLTYIKCLCFSIFCAPHPCTAFSQPAAARKRIRIGLFVSNTGFQPVISYQTPV